MQFCLQGARVASSLAHTQPDLVIGAIFFSYPLHPPGKQVCRVNVPSCQCMLPGCVTSSEHVRSGSAGPVKCCM